MTIRWGVVGPGRIARTFATAMQDNQVGEIVAVASSSPKRAQEFANEYSINTIYSSYDELFQCKSVDAIYIATTHNFHFELALKAIRQKKHLLIEKPITINEAQARELFSLAKQYNVLVMEALWSVFLPSFNQVRTWLNEGLIGDICHISSSFGFLVAKNYSDRLFDPTLAGGTLLDMGIYNIAAALWFLQDYPQKIVSECLVGPTGVDETSSLQMTFSNGVVAQSVSSFRTQMVNDLFIYGEKGHIRILPNFWGSEAVSLVIGNQTKTHQCPFLINGFEYQLRHFEGTIKKGLNESPIMSHHQSLSVLKVMDTVRAQHKLKYLNE